LFLSHGGPTLTIQNSEFTRSLKSFGQKLLKEYKIKAVIVISAHYERDCFAITCQDHLKTIHDHGY